MGEPMTKQRLTNYIFLKMEVEHQEERLARLRNQEKFPAMRESDGSQHTQGTGDRMERAIIRRMEYEDEVADQLNESIAEMRKIERAVNSLANIQEREVMRLRYLDGSGCRHMSWPEVAMAIYRDNDEKHKQAVHRIHGRALKNIAKEEY